MQDEMEHKPVDACQIPRWQYLKSTLNNLDYATFIEEAKVDGDCVLIDVRTLEEYDQGHIPGAILLDYLDRDLATKLESLDAVKKYYIYCRTGRRSARVCVILRNLGFYEVYNLEAGIVSENI